MSETTSSARGSARITNFATSLAGNVPAASVTRGSLRHMSRWLCADAPELVDLNRVWAAIKPIDDQALAGERRRMRELLDTRPDPLERHERPGHFTGSALVVHADLERTLVLFHTKLQIWVQPGGHADGNANLAGVALREATEETGIEGLKVRPVAVDLGRSTERGSAPALRRSFRGAGARRRRCRRQPRVTGPALGAPRGTRSARR